MRTPFLFLFAFFFNVILFFVIVSLFVEVPSDEPSFAQEKEENTVKEPSKYPVAVISLPTNETNASVKEKPYIPPQEEEYYIIRSGDSPWKIAKEKGISLQEFLRLNGLDEKKAKQLKPGDRVRIR